MQTLQTMYIIQNISMNKESFQVNIVDENVNGNKNIHLLELEKSFKIPN
jgi:hypothetical protein